MASSVTFTFMRGSSLSVLDFGIISCLCMMSGDWLDDMLAWDDKGSGSDYTNFTEVESSGNLTLSCAAREIQGPIMLPYSSALTTTVRVLQSLCLLMILIAGVFLNTLVIVLVAKYKKLQTQSFIVPLQLVVLDLLLSVTLLVSAIGAIANEWLFGEYVCAITGMLILIAASVRTLLLCFFVLDCFLSVFWTSFYPNHRRKIVASLSVASWVFSILLSVALVPGLLDCYTFSSVRKLCAISSECNLNCSIYIGIYYIIVIVPATVLPIIMFAMIYCKVRRLKKVLPSTTTKVGHQKQEWNATITLYFLLFVTVLVVVLPNVTIGIVFNTFSEHSPAVYMTRVVAFCLLSLLVVTDPIVIMQNANVREIMSKIKDDAIQKWFRSTNKALNKKGLVEETQNTTSL